MPNTLIEICREYSQDEEVAMIAAVHEALVSAFRIPRSDLHVRLQVFEPHRFASSPEKDQADRVTQVTIDAFAGRSIEAKRALYREIVERLEPFGISRDHVTVIVRDVPLENWGLRGGIPASELDLGFDVNV